MGKIENMPIQQFSFLLCFSDLQKQQGLKNQPSTTAGRATHPTEGEATQPGGSAQNLQTSS